MNTKHTPGPWKAFYWGAAAPEMQSPRETSYIVTTESEPDTIEECDANARLIELLPDLYELLDEIVLEADLSRSDLDHYLEITPETVDRARAILARARGERP